MIHYFSENVLFEGPYEFTDPFRYIPHQLVVKAAEDIFRHAPECFDEGKMLGVLICRDIATKKIGYLKAFSGTVRDSDGQVTASVDGFVPPIYDLTDPNGEFKKRETEISFLNSSIKTLLASEELTTLNKELAEAECTRDKELESLRTEMAASKIKRDLLHQTIRQPFTTATIP